MHDQAFQLRRLAQQNRRDGFQRSAPANVLVVAGTQAHSGATTWGLLTALAFAAEGQRTALVDADDTQADLARRLNIAGPHTLADVLSGECDIHEAVVRGPLGMQVVANVRSTAEWNAAREPRLRQQVQSLASHADVVVVDAGSSERASARAWWKVARSLVLVVSPEPTVIMDAYAALKAHVGDETAAVQDVRLFVNRAENEGQARDVYQRFEQSCQRFLARSVAFAGFSPHDPAVATPDVPSVASLCAGPFAAACEAFAAEWTAASTLPHRRAA